MSRRSVPQGRQLRLTPSARAFPMSDEFLRLVGPQLFADLEEQMLTLVWRGYDRLVREYGPVIASLGDRQIERDVSSALAIYMADERDPMASFHVQHEVPEMATAASKGAPPSYDIAFILIASLCLRWPLEAKVLQNERKVTAYVAEVRNNLLAGRYAPFSRSAGMLGFLLTGRPEAAAAHIAEKLEVALDPLPPYHPNRPHYRSLHRRDPCYHQAVAGEFACHHLIMPMSGTGILGS